MIECKKYTLTEFKKVLQITKWQWEERKADLLKHLSVYFDYELIQVGRGYCIDIKEQYLEYEPLQRKSKVPEMETYYYGQTRDEVEKQPWNTGSNISRNIIANNKNIYNHAEATIANYVRPIIKHNFSKEDAQWMRQSEDHLSYEPLTQEQLDYLTYLFDQHNVNNRKATIMSHYKSGYITKEEAKELIFDITDTWYGYIMIEFKNKYHFTPQSVCRLEEIQNFEN